MFRKYEKTFRILVPQIDIHGKYFLSDQDTKRLFGGKLIITEKLDGANVGIVRHKDTYRLQKRGSLVDRSEHEQYNFFRDWAFRNEDKLMRLPKGTVAYGELMRCIHTIHYNRLPDWVCFFDIWSNQHNEYLPWDETVEIFKEVGLYTVPWINSCEGVNRGNIFNMIPKISLYGSGDAEGVVVKNYRQQLRGKVVQEKFVKEMEESDHWRQQPLRFNSLRG